MGRRKVLNCQHCGGNEENQGTWHPHNDAGSRLVSESICAKEPRRGGIGGIKNVFGEGQDSGYQCVEQVSSEKINRPGPERPNWPTRKRKHDRPPKKQCCDEKAGVLGPVPAG